MKLGNRTILITEGSRRMCFDLAKRLLERRNVAIITGTSQEYLHPYAGFREKLEAEKEHFAGWPRE